MEKCLILLQEEIYDLNCMIDMELTCAKSDGSRLALRLHKRNARKMTRKIRKLYRASHIINNCKYFF